VAVGDIFKVTLGGTFQQQLCLNVFHYVRDGVGSVPDLADFAAAFKSDVVEIVAGMVSNQFVWNRLDIQDVNISGPEYHELGSFQNGGLTSTDDLPSFCAWSFLMQRTQRVTFHGHKRFAGVPESLQDDGVPNSTAETLAGIAGAALKGVLTVGTVDYLPCIYSTILNGVPRSTPLVNLVKDAVFMGISSQNTRKHGRGA